MTAEPEPADDRYDELYERYARPLEADHWGEFIIIAPDGGYVLGDSRLKVLASASTTLGRGHFMYRIGTRCIESVPGTWAKYC